MSTPLREIVAPALSSSQQLEAELSRLTTADWQATADLFAAKLPEFDAVLALPGADVLAGAVARARGVPLCHSAAQLPAGGGEAVGIVPQLLEGTEWENVAAELRAAGWKLLLVAAAVERTNKGARTLLGEQDIPVRAVLQVADTPRGLVFERRTPDRWAN